jgi:hypothetical protein
MIIPISSGSSGKIPRVAKLPIGLIKFSLFSTQFRGKIPIFSSGNIGSVWSPSIKYGVLSMIQQRDLYVLHLASHVMC